MSNSFKISILGERNVGKTSIVTAYTKNEFSFQTLETTGIETCYKKKTFDEVEYTFKIFDTAGQERYNSISSTTIQMADGFFMVFAVDNRKSFERIVTWIKYIEDYVNLEEKVIFIIGNKSDVKQEEREITKEEAENLAKGYQAKYLETSAYTREGINDAFEKMFTDIYEMKKPSNNKNNNDNKNSNIVIDRDSYIKENKKKKKCLCF